MKLEPTEAQRKAMAEKLLSGTPRWAPPIFTDESALKAVDEMFAAANSIPEGPPVGTIARRPDGEWIAWRTEDGWGYRFIGDEEPNEWPPGSNIADSWPVIYDPTSEKTREEKIQDYLEWSETQVDTDALDPIAQQEPGESLARGLDDIAAGRVSRRDDYLEPQQEPATTHPVSPESTNCVPKPRTPRVVDRQQEPALRERFPEQASAYVADPELVEVDDEPLPSGSLITPKPRTPRVVDRLGVDEQGSRWLDANGKQWSWSPYLERWGYFRHVENGSVWVLGDQDLHGPFREILEPHVLPSLDCEEARDGTVWEARYVLLAGREQTPGWKFQHTQDGWVYEDGSRVLSPEFLTGRGPYTEVLGDPS
ncbi:XRE family transcriptional regulator [Mycobacteroides abscessus]|uniref:XRE family transcriptional regulator n=1 Tax=Mycobacteroides abscessus TaxID=36809 RepID=UPI00266C52DC|nr:XRE family transcriptional regulator [Mycobacteroides abscessus]MDO3331577.1 XRE family transcriptional regulator [Mycobacteroides abscessus subsp. abscessus]